MSLPKVKQFSAPPYARLAMTALMGATILAMPLGVARADEASGAPMQLAQNGTASSASGKHAAAKDATSSKPESVEERITSLHAALKITPDEEANWNAVAQAMRDNAANMQKLIADKKAQAPQNMSAVDDLKTYQEFAQAHVDGLKNLTSSFETLYDSMPDQQKKVADQVFRNFGPRHRSAHNAARREG